MSQSFLAAARDRAATLAAIAELEPIPLSPSAPSRPLRHIVAFKCADFSAAKAKRLSDALSRLPTQIQELGDFHYGPDMGMREPGHNADYCITADFDNQEAYQAFCSHPAYYNVSVRGLLCLFCLTL